MTPGQQRRKDGQDEARRQQQADERVRELEKEIERLRKLHRLNLDTAEKQPPGGYISIKSVCESALDGGGDADE